MIIIKIITNDNCRINSESELNLENRFIFYVNYTINKYDTILVCQIFVNEFSNESMI